MSDLVGSRTNCELVTKSLTERFGFTCKVEQDERTYTITVNTSEGLTPFQQMEVMAFFPVSLLVKFKHDPGLAPCMSAQEAQDLVDAVHDAGRFVVTLVDRNTIYADDTTGSSVFREFSFPVDDLNRKLREKNGEPKRPLTPLQELTNAVALYTPRCSVGFDGRTTETRVVIITDRGLTWFEKECLANVAPELPHTMREFQVDPTLGARASDPPNWMNQIRGAIECLRPTVNAGARPLTDEERYLDWCKRMGLDPDVPSCDKPSEPNVLGPTHCLRCEQPFNAHRHRVGNRPGNYCGDCFLKPPVPLDERIAAVKPPEPEHKGAWMTPTWDGEW